MLWFPCQLSDSAVGKCSLIRYKGFGHLYSWCHLSSERKTVCLTGSAKVMERFVGKPYIGYKLYKTGLFLWAVNQPVRYTLVVPVCSLFKFLIAPRTYAQIMKSCHISWVTYLLRHFHSEGGFVVHVAGAFATGEGISLVNAAPAKGLGDSSFFCESRRMIVVFIFVFLPCFGAYSSFQRERKLLPDTASPTDAGSGWKRVKACLFNQKFYFAFCHGNFLR